MGKNNIKKIFENFDFSNFWDNNKYSSSYISNSKITDKLIKSIESQLGFKLPDSYIKFMKVQNGGIPLKNTFSLNKSEFVISSFIKLENLPVETVFMINEWEYPNIGVCICDCPSAGHDIIMLDYRKCGNNGDPEVVHIDQEYDYKITLLSKNFETFIKKLTN